MSKDNGGPAFPTEGPIFACGSAGMTLRDYFAAKALQGLLACPDAQASPKAFSEISYEQADAMLEARKS